MFAGNMVKQSAHLVDEAGNAAGHVLQATRHSVDWAWHGVGHVAGGAARHLRHGIRDEPLAAVLIALVVGAALVGPLALWRSRN